MSRRHASSRRRNYRRRQHEVRERRTPTLGAADWHDRATADHDWGIVEPDEQRPPAGTGGDGYGTTQP